MRLSNHFGLDELIVSEVAARHDIDMTVPPDVLENLTMLCRLVLDPIRSAVNAPVIVTSGYRPLQLNLLVGGSKNSDHLTGCAADIIAAGESIERLWDCVRAVAQYAPVKQVIREFPPGGWIHVSLDRASIAEGQQGRRAELLVATRKDGQTTYARWV